MTFSDDAINEFIIIWQRECGVQLSPDEARSSANRLMDLCSLLAQPLPSADDTYSSQ